MAAAPTLSIVPTSTGLSNDQNLGVFRADLIMFSNDGSFPRTPPPFVSSKRVVGLVAVVVVVVVVSSPAAPASSRSKYRVSGSIFDNHCA